jgi:hypothetical protein
MKSFELNKFEFKEEDLYIIHLYKKPFLKSYNDDMELLIKYFNEEYKWDNMFKIEDVYDRIENNENLFILYLNRNVIGYVWFKEIDKNICYLYNLYVTNIVQRPDYSPRWFVNKTCCHMIQYYKKIKCECEDWNNAAHNIFKLNGFKEI